jgi:acyl dehydratase
MFDKTMLGHSFPAFTLEIERSKIHELALAIGDVNPIYHDSAAARAAGYSDVPLPPTAPTLLTFWGNTQMWEQMKTIGISITRVLHGEEEYTYLAPIKPGDTLIGVMTIVDGKSLRGTDIVITETRYTNQDGQHVLNSRTMFAVRE